MIIERQLEDAFITTLSAMSELSCAQIVGSRTVAPQGETKEEEDTAKTIVAVACGFRQNDAFSLSPITMPLSISILTRVELDTNSEEHDRIVEAIADLLSRWHKYGEEMSEALTTDKFFAGELRMDGGTARIFDPTKATWSETISFSIRGSEKFAPAPDPSLTLVTYVGEHTAQYSLSGTLNSGDLPNRDAIHYVRIGSSIDEIGNRAFSGMEFLLGVEIPDTVEAIGGCAFAGAERMTDIEIPSSVLSIGSEALFGCHSLSSVTFDGKTLEQVQAMEDYPWGISDTSIINVQN